MDKKKIKNVRGTKDILPDESYKWWDVEQKVRRIFEVYNYREIRTPIFEETELFERGIGELTDIVSKEMYTFVDKGGTSLTLKPEMTASVMRAYLQYEINKQTPLFKVYYISPMFRQERPQAGRLRQFHQIGAEAIGSANPEVDAEIIYLVINILESFGIKNYNLKINSVGCQVCRPTYKEVLKRYFEKFQDELSEDSKKRLQKNPLRILDSKDERDKSIAKDAPLIYNYLCSNCKEHFENLQDYLNFLGVKYENEPHLVRGLDYYTKTAFEITSPDLGSQDAIAGGGRYDLLSKDLGGPEIPGVGFALGVERLMLILEKNNYNFNEISKPFVYIACIGAEAQKIALKVTFALRQNMIPCEVELLGRSLKSQMKEADRQKAQYVVIIGETEIERGKGLVRNMLDGKQTEVELDKILEYILSKYAEKTAENRTRVQI
ncbi:MAG: histidine--tRNA ligase [Candidatus Kryptonium sp.]